MKNGGKISKLVVPLAGLGTRFLPTSTAYPKEMAYLVDKPVIQYLIEEAYKSGITEIIFIINSQKKIIKKYLDGFHQNIYTSKAFSNDVEPDEYSNFKKIISSMKFRYIEKGFTKGDGHSVLLSKKYIKKNEYFALSMGDLIGFGEEPFLSQLIKIWKEHKKPVVSVEQVLVGETSKFGVIDPYNSKKRLHHVRGIVEKPVPKMAPSNLAMTGKYILNSDIFTYIEARINTPKKGEILTSDSLSDYAKENTLLAYQCRGKILDTGNKVDFIKTTITLSLAHPEIGKILRKFISRL